MAKQNSNKMLELSAYLVREASGLDDHEPVALDAGAEAVRRMALGAKRERDDLIAAVRERDDANRKLRHERDRALSDARVLTGAVDDWAETSEQHEAEIKRLREQLRLADEMATGADHLAEWCIDLRYDESSTQRAKAARRKIDAYRKARGGMVDLDPEAQAILNEHRTELYEP